MKGEEGEEATRYPASPRFSFLLPNLKASSPRVSSGPGGRRQTAGTVLQAAVVRLPG